MLRTRALLTASTCAVALFASLSPQATAHRPAHKHRASDPHGIPRVRSRAPRGHSPRVHHVAAFNRSRPPRSSAQRSVPVPSMAEGEGAATIASVLATPCQNAELLPSEGNLPLVREAILCLINHERAQNGEQPLRIDADLQAAAEGHASELISADYFAHVSPSGVSPVDRIRATGYISDPSVGYVIGENLAWGTYNLATPQSIVSAWIASPGHLANILEAQYRDTGVGVLAAVPSSLGGAAPGATYAQEFGTIIH